MTARSTGEISKAPPQPHRPDHAALPGVPARFGRPSANALARIRRTSLARMSLCQRAGSRTCSSSDWTFSSPRDTTAVLPQIEIFGSRTNKEGAFGDRRRVGGWVARCLPSPSPEGCDWWPARLVPRGRRSTRRLEQPYQRTKRGVGRSTRRQAILVERPRTSMRSDNKTLPTMIVFRAVRPRGRITALRSWRPFNAYPTRLDGYRVGTPTQEGRPHMSVVIRFNPTNVTREKYDESLRRLKEAGPWPADGMDYHVLFGSEGNLRVSEIWDSREQFEAYGETLMPILTDLGIEFSGEPEFFEVHNIVKR